VSAHELHERPLLLRRSEVTEVTGWCKRTIAALVASGALKVVKTEGGHRRFLRVQIEGLVAEANTRRNHG